MEPEPYDWWPIVEDALAEDIGHGDVTSGCLSPDLLVDWHIEAQSEGFVCGVGIAEHLLGPYGSDPDQSAITAEKVDGDHVRRGDIVIQGRQLARRVMSAERTTLNFLMHLSGVATLTAQFVGKVQGTDAKIVDTRKTLPGLRALEKYAVRCGGGHNHRMGLYDGILVKDNHIAAAGSIRQAVEAIRSYASHMSKIEVECESLEDVQAAIEAGAEAVLLDNMDPFMMREAVQRFGDKCLIEASGGISLDTVAGVAKTGVALISVGQITHSAPALSFHLEIG
ncbi:MAG: carboxylating nicotinate-nucleotide diphosphorylase [Fimbriimonas ginsengisoli]|uniref:nicotinate-nucleotide diphosphorylase (carboxylating) n=1 Tax=Fimbriimonas ginsengisoli TaxID=1005039 RepID=A0A931LT91_FIMGI|nr:carboxylating nicotinate-nucleotide diphosphorylase [Fimbriimonas ginsengisoli]MBI3721623.1 carboxylating nicotinate-nucleotide diphosphorylase [Fimbriimonas ginsengisoli]